MIYGSIFQFEGQVSVFHVGTKKVPEGFSYRDLYPAAPPEPLAQNCGDAGVMGILPGIIGTLQASEAIKLVACLGTSLAGSLLLFDALTSRFKRLALSKRAPAFLGPNADPILEISPAELTRRLSSEEPPLVIDVRTLAERLRHSMGGEHIPLENLAQRYLEIERGRPVVVYCESGLRSSRAALYLRSVLPLTQVFSLRGGLRAAQAGIRPATVLRPPGGHRKPS